MNPNNDTTVGTPRTDSRVFKVNSTCLGQSLVNVDFARQLELETISLREENERLREANKNANTAIGDIANECKVYVDQLSKLRATLEKK
jgi:hypothetical protein